MRENRTSSSMRGRRKRATVPRACALLYAALPIMAMTVSLLTGVGTGPPACGSRAPGEGADSCTTQQHNTHIRDVRVMCYGWHPWHGRTVQVHSNLVKRGRPVAYCSLEDVPTCRVLEVPLWMLDVATCCKTRLSRPGFVSVQFLRELKEVLQSAQGRVRDQTAPEAQHRYWLDIGGADGSITGPAKNEPAHDVCSSATQPTLDRPAARCSTQDNSLDGAVTEAASSNSCGSGNDRGGAR